MAPGLATTTSRIDLVGVRVPALHIHSTPASTSDSCSCAADIQQAQSAVDQAQAQRQSAEANQTALEQSVSPPCADTVNPLTGAKTSRNTTACGQAKAAASAAVRVAVSSVLMYLLMMLLFRSVSLPLAVLMSLPLGVIGALGIEAGAELLRAAAIVLIGGLTTSTLLTLLFVPAMYTVFDDVEAAVVRAIQRVAPPRQLEPAELDVLHAVPQIAQVKPAREAA